jgi:DNA-directed RNA polymerase subunit RPC12/RpoP
MKFVFYKSSSLDLRAPGTWHTADSVTDNQQLPVIRCVRCRDMIVLNKRYAIGTDGIVNPDVQCPWCGWRTPGRLADWHEQAYADPVVSLRGK